MSTFWFCDNSLAGWIFARTRAVTSERSVLEEVDRLVLGISFLRRCVVCFDQWFYVEARELTYAKTVILTTPAAVIEVRTRGKLGPPLDISYRDDELE